MSDRELQQLERRWRATGSEEALDAWLRARIRHGYCGHRFVNQCGAIAAGKLGLYETGRCALCQIELRRTTAHGVEEIDQDGKPVYWREPRSALLGMDGGPMKIMRDAGQPGV